MNRDEQLLNSKPRTKYAGYFRVNSACPVWLLHFRRGRFINRPPLFALILLLTATVAARADKVDDYVKAEMQKQRIPGLSLAVIKDGKIIKVEGYGLANVELSVPARPETVYKIGSVSKQFIAAGILLLVQEGRISLDDKINQFLDGAPDTWKEITVRHLLTHTSGIVREAPGFDPLKIQRDADVIKTAYPLPLRFAPGEKYEYCNVGYFTLAEIIRKVTGKPWSDYLNERLFLPLEMNTTRATTMTEIVQNRANGYAWKDGKLQNAEIYFALRPSGAFLSSVLDLAKWDAALYTDRILKQSVRDQMWSPVKLNNGAFHPYGFGWELTTVGGRRQVRHGGSLPGFRAALSRFVDDKLTVVVLTNGDNVDPMAIALGVADLYIPGLIPVRAVTRVDPKVFDAYVGQYQPNPSVVLTVTREGDKLMVQQSSSAEKRELLPENEASFFTNENRQLTFSFVKDEKGQVTHLTLQREGREIARAKKIK
ncbi:MAG TPA: serine hydrolase [Blastocatellia bacterium]|nr:serine hydrolase [Blastocatellia bacterium]